MAIYDPEKMKQKEVYPTKQTPSYADWALFQMGKELEDSGGSSLSGGNGIDITEGVVSAKIGTGLEFNENGEIEATGTALTAGDGIEIDGAEISAKIGNGLQFDENGAIETSGGEGHEYTGNAPITVDNVNDEIGITMDSAPTAGSSNPVTSDGINQTNNAITTALMQYTDNQVSGKADKNKFNTVAGYQVYTEGTPADIPVAIDSTVVHKTDAETIAGNKTFTGNNEFRAANTDFTNASDYQRVRIIRTGISSPTTEVLGTLRFTDLANDKNIQLFGRYIDANNLALYVQDVNAGASRTFRIEPGGGTTPAGLLKQMINAGTPKGQSFTYVNGMIYMAYLKNISSYGISPANWTSAITGTINPTFEDKYFTSVIGHFRADAQITTTGGLGVVGHYALDGQFVADVSVYFQGVNAWNNSNDDTVIATIEISAYNGASHKVKQISVTKNNFSNYFGWFKVYDVTT